MHSERLQSLAQQAQSQSNPTLALPLWRETLALLPPGAQQHRAIAERVERLCREIDTGTAQSPAKDGNQPAKESRKAGLTGAAGVLLALALKFKFVIIFALSKAKLLLLGLTKMSTLLTMFASFGLYWTLWGWKFAAGFVGSIYVHEMGHVAALRRLGIKATAPMFIPGFGAVVRLREALHTPIEDARVGLAGPIWGLGAAAAAWLAAHLLHSPMWDAIAQAGAWINIFNLTPVWQLDGARAFRALDRSGRFLAVSSVVAAWFFTHEGLLVLSVLAGAAQLFNRTLPAHGDKRTLLEYVLLVGLLSLIGSVRAA